MNKLNYFLILLFTLGSGMAHAELPGKVQASFDVIGFGMTLAKINETFSRDGDTYQIESVTKAVGLLARFKPETVRVISHGKITANGLQPLAFSMTRELDTGKNASAKFNWDKSILTHTDYKGVNDMPLPKVTQDKLSLLYHLSQVAKSGKNELKLNVTDGNNLETYSFTITADSQSIEVPLGTFKARLATNTILAEEMKYEIWMAEEREYYPCKIVVTDTAGSKLTQVLTDLVITP